MTAPAFTLTHRFAAPRALVWRAWTDPALTVRWWHPAGVEVDPASVTVDLRLGGTYTYTMTLEGERWPTAGTYLTVDPPQLLRFTWRGPEVADEGAPVATVVLREVDTATTEMTFTLEGHDPADAQSVREGWISAFDEVLAPLLRSEAGELA